MKKILSLLMIVSAQTSIISQVKNNSISDAGDIAIVAYHDDPDGFSFVLFDDCPDTTTIKFIDEEWTGASFASATTEGEVTWTNNTGNIISQGTVIHIEHASNNNPGIQASVGTATESDGGFALSLDNDEIIAITGTRSSYGTFLSYFGDSDTAGSTLSGTNLTDGTNAIYQPTVTEGYYSGPDNCSNLSLTDCAKQFNTISNWTFGSYNFPENVISSIEISGVLQTTPSKNIIQFSFYPNPVNKFIHINSPHTIHTVTIYDITGQIVFTKHTNKNKLDLDLSTLKKGYYILKTDSEIKNQVFKFQKN